jgi:hypothetical protein
MMPIATAKHSSTIFVERFTAASYRYNVPDLKQFNPGATSFHSRNGLLATEAGATMLPPLL